MDQSNNTQMCDSLSLTEDNLRRLEEEEHLKGYHDVLRSVNMLKSGMVNSQLEDIRNRMNTLENRIKDTINDHEMAMKDYECLFKTYDSKIKNLDSRLKDITIAWSSNKGSTDKIKEIEGKVQIALDQMLKLTERSVKKGASSASSRCPSQTPANRKKPSVINISNRFNKK